MIVTLTPNTVLDKVIFVDDFSFGETARAQDVVYGMGGKGAVVSWVLGQLGFPSIATGFAAGETGRRIEAMLQAVGVQTCFVWVQGETRTNYVLARTADGSQGTVAVEGLSVTPRDVQTLHSRVIDLLPQAHYLFCGGSMPEGMPVDAYAPLIVAARKRGVQTMMDTSGQFLAPNAAALPDVIKPNAAEASALLGWSVETVEQAVEAVRELWARGIPTPIVTLGERGAVAGVGESIFFIPPLGVRVRNTAGAGDGFGAGLLQARLQGKDWPESLRWATAVAAAVLLTPGTGECRLEDVQRLYPQVHLELLQSASYESPSVS